MTNQPTTDQQLDDIQTRANAATPGPWGIYESGSLIDIAADLQDTGCGYRARRGIARLEDEPLDNDPAHREWTDEDDWAQVRSDAEFIAHARADIAALLAEVHRLRNELEAAQRLAADATAYQVHIPESGGTTLLVRRQALAHGTGWAVSTMAPGGGRAWTTEGWQDSISALSVDRLFCWPDPAAAAAEARRALAAPAVSGAADSRPA